MQVIQGVKYMGQEMGLELREDSLMTKVMLKQEQQVIEHIEEDKIEINRAINQVGIASIKMGDTLLHYAAYKGLKRLIEYLLEHDADPYILNNRALAPIDVALPHIREWLVRQHNRILQQKGKQNNQSTPTAKKVSNEVRSVKQ